MMNNKRKTEKKTENAKENTMSYEEFDWNKTLNDGTLAKQRVPVLNKYIEKHNLFAVKTKKKSQKVQAIVDHLQSSAKRRDKQTCFQVEDLDNECEIDETDEAFYSSSDEDIVIREIGELSESESDF